jgi:DNA-binding NarL/FixJ family response regulator
MESQTTSLVLITNENQELNYKNQIVEQKFLLPNVDITVVNDIQSFVGLLSNQSFHLDIVIIDIKKINELVKTNVYDIIYTLNTLGLCSTEKTKIGEIRPRDFSVAVGISLQDEISLIDEIIRSDIRGIYPLGKEFSDEERIESIDSIMCGKTFIPPSVKSMLNRNKKTKSQEMPDLTARQKQVLNLVKTRGASNKVIARQLNISESTVKLHMSAIFKKYGVRNRTQLALSCKSNNPH